MPRRVAISTLNASTIDILNTIRANAGYEYQSLVPEVETERDVPRVGEIIVGYPALANQFVNALINRIALVRVRSMTFNNDYAELKKGYLEYGETVEEVFVNIAKAVEFSTEKAASREFKRTIPDVRSAFHVRNWRVFYPVTIEDEELRTAFLSIDGVQDLIARIVDTLYTAANYDEYLLFKYLMIKAIAHGKMFPVAIPAGTDNESAISFRGYSNVLGFPSNAYNAAGVTTTTPKADQYIFMDAMYNAQFDVNVLSSAFNMDKAEFIGKLKLIDNWGTFDNERFSVITENSDAIEPVTAEELAITANVVAVLIDREWFQVYDNNNKFTEKYVAAGLYWNYFYHTWKTVSSSPFSNAIVFVKSDTPINYPASITAEVTAVDTAEHATLVTLTVDYESASLTNADGNFVQTQDATEKGIAVHKYGVFIFPDTQTTTSNAQININGNIYTARESINSAMVVGTTVTFDKG